MKSPKSIFVLAVLALALAVLNVSLRRPGADARSMDRLVFADLSSDVCGLRLVRPSAPSAELRLAEGKWRLVSPFSGSADAQAVMRVVDALARTPVVDTVTDAELVRLSRSRAELALDRPVLRLELTDDRGETAGLSFGAHTPANDGVYVAMDGIPAVFVAPTGLLASVDLPADAFRRRAVFPSDAGAPSAFEIKRADGVPRRFVRLADGWTFNGERASRKVDGFVEQLVAASAVSFLWPVGASNETDHVSASLLAGYGLDPDACVTVTLTDGASGAVRRVSFGKEAENGLVYALVQNGGAVVTLPGALKDFVCQDTVLFADSRVFPLEARAVGGFSIAAEGDLYSLSRGKDGLWQLESPIVAPADQAFAESLLARVLSLSSADVVAEGGLTVTVSTNGAKIAVSRERLLGAETFEALRSREMLKVDSALVKRLVSTSGGKGAKSAAVAYDRDRRQWNAENGEGESAVADEKGVKAVLAALNPLKAVAVVKLNVKAADLDDFGLDTPSLTVAVDQDSSEAVRRNILVGKKAKGGAYATIGSSDAVFVLSDETVRQLSTPIVGQ